MAKPPPTSGDLTTILADIANLKARVGGCEANIGLLKGVDQALTDRVALAEDRLDALEAGGGGGTPPPVDGNIYPLTMQPVVVPGDAVVLGAGPDALTLTLACYYNTLPGNYNSVAVLLDGKVIAAPLVVSSTSAADSTGRQLFTLHGSWGPAPHTVTLVSGLSGQGISGLWINGITYNFLPLVYNGPSVDARGAMPPPNTTTLWDNTGVPVTFSTEQVVVAPPPPVPVPPTLSVVHGATMNGLLLADGTVAELIARGVPGDKLLLPEGTFVGTAPIPVAMEVAGAGMGLTTIDCSGLKPTYLKGVLVPLVSGAVIRDLTLKGAHIAAADGGNAAGIRNNDPDVDFSVLRVQITGCDNGVLTHPCVVDMTDCWTHGNGNSNVGGGSTHEMYFNGQDGRSKVTLTRHRSEAGHLATHALKSRASTLIVVDSTFVGNGDDGTNGGAVVDIPNGGSANFTNCHISMGAGAGNHTLVQYATDAVTNAPYGTRLTFGRVVVQDTSGTGGLIKSGLAGANMTIVDSDYVGSTKPVYSGWANVDGDFIPLVVV